MPDAAFPWRRLMEVGLGLLGWPPESFWAATPADLLAALEGYAEKIGARRDALPPITRAELEALRLRFPDGGQESGIRVQ
jgi:uncharacterized phage protein (TIGR02216 family)